MDPALDGGTSEPEVLRLKGASRPTAFCLVHGSRRALSFAVAMMPYELRASQDGLLRHLMHLLGNFLGTDTQFV